MFNSYESLLRKIVIFNHNREILTCMFCDYTCRFEKLLKQHIRTKHKEENAFSDDEEQKVNAETEEDTGGAISM